MLGSEAVGEHCANFKVIVAHPLPSGIRAWDLGSLCNRFIRLRHNLYGCKFFVPPNLWDCESIWALMDEADLLLLSFSCLSSVLDASVGQLIHFTDAWVGNSSDHEESATAFFP